MKEQIFEADGLVVWVDGDRLWFAPCETGHDEAPYYGEGRLTRDEVFRLRDSLQLWLEETHVEQF